MKEISQQQKIKNLERFTQTQIVSILDKIKTFDLRAFQVLVNNKFPKIKTHGSCFITGKVHTGKTVELCNRVAEWCKFRYTNSFPKIDFEIVNFVDLLQEIKNTYEPGSKYSEQQIIDKYRKCTLLAIDDIGVAKTTEWTLMVFYSIVNFRYSQLKPTMYTSNYDLDELTKVLGDERVVRRIAHDCGDNILEFTNVK